MRGAEVTPMAAMDIRETLSQKTQIKLPRHPAVWTSEKKKKNRETAWICT